MLLASIALVIATAALLIYAVFWIFSALHRIPVGLIVVIALGALSGVWAVLRGMLASVQRAKTSTEAVRLTSNEAPHLFALIREVASTLGAAVPDNVLLSVGPDFFVTEARVVAFDGSYAGRTLCISAPLIRLLTEKELRGILAHELAHFTGDDTAFSRRFYPVYRGTSVALSEMGLILDSSASGERSGAASLPLLLALFLLRWYLNCFARLERGIGRARELRADREAAKLIGDGAMASALVKVHAYAPAWHEIVLLTRESISLGKSLVNTSTFFAQQIAPHGDRISDTLSSEANSSVVHPTDTHPPLCERLRALGVKAGEAPVMETGDPASSLIACLEAKEEELSDLLTALVHHRLNAAGSTPSAQQQ